LQNALEGDRAQFATGRVSRAAKQLSIDYSLIGDCAEYWGSGTRTIYTESVLQYHCTITTVKAHCKSLRSQAGGPGQMSEPRDARLCRDADSRRSLEDLRDAEPEPE